MFETVNVEALLTLSERQKIYYEVAHEFHVEDAAYQVEMFCDYHDIREEDREKFDYEVLATTFEDRYDCNIAENDMWVAVLWDYVEDNEIPHR